MSSLKHCLRKNSLSAEEKSDLDAAAQIYIDEGYSKKEAINEAVGDIVSDLQDEHSDIMDQVANKLPKSAKAKIAARELKQAPVKEDIPDTVDEATPDTLFQDKTPDETPDYTEQQYPETSNITPYELPEGFAVDWQGENEQITRKVAGTDLKPFLDHLGGAEDAKELFARTVHQFEGRAKGARRDVITWDETEQMASMLGWTVKDLMKRRKGQAFNAEEWEASRAIIDQAMAEVMEAAKTAVGGSDADVLNFQQRLAKFTPLAEQVLGARAEWGRMGSIMRKQAMQAEQLTNIIDSLGGRETIETKAEALNDLVEHGMPPEKIREAIPKIAEPRFIDKVVEVWINFLLSGPQTHVVNITSNQLIDFLSIPETLVAGVMGKLHGGDKVYLSETLARAHGLIHGMKEGSLLAAQTLKTGQGSDIFSKIESKYPKAIKGKAGEIIRLPGVALTAMDEFYKAVGFRMDLNARALRLAITEGKQGSDVSARAKEIVDKVMVLREEERPKDTAQGGLFSKTTMNEQAKLWELHDKAQHAARYMTYTNPLGPLGKTFSHLAARWPFPFKFIMPFIRTPTNIVKFAGHRSPLAITMPSFWKQIKEGGAERDTAMARVVVGTGIGVTVMMLAAQGVITGSGPTERRERGIWLNKYQPNSIKIDGTWYSYGRLEPLGMLFGISADFAHALEVMPDKEADEVAMLIHTSIIKNLASKTFLRGITEAVAAYYDPDRYGKRWVVNFAGSLVPTGVAQVARVTDPNLRQASGIIEKWKSRIPGLSETLLPRLNVMGEPIVLGGGLGPDILSPIYMGEDPRDPAIDELLRLRVFPSYPQRKIGGIQLTPAQFNEYVEMAGKGAKEFITNMIKMPAYKNTPDVFKAEILEKVFLEHRNIARAKLLMKYPDISEKGLQKKVEKYGIKLQPPPRN